MQLGADHKNDNSLQKSISSDELSANPQSSAKFNQSHANNYSNGNLLAPRDQNDQHSNDEQAIGYHMHNPDYDDSNKNNTVNVNIAVLFAFLLFSCFDLI